MLNYVSLSVIIIQILIISCDLFDELIDRLSVSHAQILLTQSKVAGRKVKDSRAANSLRHLG